MRNNKKRGFTLVELLVVIAILAILATVSVVGYTSFITRASVSNDENVAAQLNKFMVALKADHTGDFYGEEIDETNIREVTALILKDSGLNELVPQSLDYGYNFYYDLETGEYVVMEDKKILNAGIHYLIDAFADEPSAYEVKLENCFTQGNRYFFVGTPSDNSRLAQIVNGFYNLDSDTDVKTLLDLASNFDSKLYAFVSNAVVVTDNCNYRISNTPTFVIFADGVKSVGTTTKQWNDGAWGESFTADSLATLTAPLTIPKSVKHFAEDSLNLGAEGTIIINKTVADVAKMANANFAENVTFKLKDGTYYTADNGQLTGNESKAVITDNTTAPTIELPLEYSNPMERFDIYVANGANIKNIYTDQGALTNTANVAWELDSFDLYLNAVGADPTIPATHTDVTWTIVSGTGLSIDGNTAKFDRTKTISDVSDVITLKATSKSNSSVTQTFTINVGKTTAATINFAYKDFAMSGTDNKVTFVYDAEAVDYAVTIKGDVTNNEAGAALTLNNDLAVTLGEGSTGITLTNTTAKVVGAGSGTITVKIGKYLTNTISYEIIDASQFTVRPIKNDILVGNGNTINVSDLFTGTIPTGAELRLYNTPAQNDNFMVPDRTLVPLSTVVGTNGVTMGAVENTIENVTMDKTIKFEGTRTEQVYMAFFVNDTRVSNDLRVTVVDGLNVTDYAALTTDAGINKILLSNITMPTDYTALITLTEATLYGNGYVIDLRNYDDDGESFTVDGSSTFTFIDLQKTVPYSKTDEALVTLNKATLNNVKIVGEAYTSDKFIYQDPTNFAYGASLVKATDGSYIVDCYLANTRAPLTMTGTVTVEDTVLFGGNYANIVIEPTKQTSWGITTTVAGELILKGTVTTINQIIEGETTSAGLGIAVDVQAHKDTKVSPESSTTLVQYNYLKQTECSNLPVVTFTMSIPILTQTVTEDINIFLSEEVEKVFSDTTAYGHIIFDQTDEKYINTGVMFLNGMSFDGSSASIELTLGNKFGSICGTGDKLGDATTYPTNYSKVLTSVGRTKTVLRQDIVMTESIYLHAPQNTSTFNNEVPNDYLPSTILGE